MMKKGLFTLGLLTILSSFGWAQKGGYYDKFNELNFNLFNAIFRNEIELNYKINKWAHTALGFTLGYTKNSHPVFEKEYNYGSLWCELSMGGRCRIKENEIGTVDIKGLRFEFSLLFNKSAAGMPMPQGYYKSLSLARFGYSLVQSIDSLGPQDYSNRGWDLNFAWGRDYLIGERLTIDIGLKIGGRLGKVSYEGGSFSQDDFMIKDVYPIKGRVFNIVYNKGYNGDYARYFFLHANPFVKIGFLF